MNNFRYPNSLVGEYQLQMKLSRSVTVSGSVSHSVSIIVSSGGWDSVSIRDSFALAWFLFQLFCLVCEGKGFDPSEQILALIYSHSSEAIIDLFGSWVISIHVMYHVLVIC